MTNPADSDLRELLQRGFRYALSLSHNETAAEDLLQEACLRLSKSQGPWNRGYLFATIRNYFIDLERRASLAPMVSLEEAEGVEDPPPPVGLSLEAALGGLRPEEREALFLTAVEGYTAQELSEWLEMPRGTVLSLIHRARQKLKKRLGAESSMEARHE